MTVAGAGALAGRGAAVSAAAVAEGSGGKTEGNIVGGTSVKAPFWGLCKDCVCAWLEDASGGDGWCTVEDLSAVTTAVPCGGGAFAAATGAVRVVLLASGGALVDACFVSSGA